MKPITLNETPPEFQLEEGIQRFREPVAVSWKASGCRVRTLAEGQALLTAKEVEIRNGYVAPPKCYRLVEIREITNIAPTQDL